EHRDACSALIPHVDRILKSSEMMSALIENQLDLSQIDSGQILTLLRSLAAASLLTDARESYAPVVAEKRQRLTVLPIDQSVRVRCDYTRIMQVFSNLIGNAHRYAPEGTTITLSAQLDGNFV